MQPSVQPSALCAVSCWIRPWGWQCKYRWQTSTCGVRPWTQPVPNPYGSRSIVLPTSSTARRHGVGAGCFHSYGCLGDSRRDDAGVSPIPGHLCNRKHIRPCQQGYAFAGSIGWTLLGHAAVFCYLSDVPVAQIMFRQSSQGYKSLLPWAPDTCPQKLPAVLRGINLHIGPQYCPMQLS